MLCTHLDDAVPGMRTEARQGPVRTQSRFKAEQGAMKG